MNVLLTVLTWMGLIALGLVALVVLLALLEATIEQIAQWRRNRRVTSLEGPNRPSLRDLALLVDVDEEAGVLRPSVQVSGGPVPGGATVRIDLVDEWGTIRLIVGRDFPSRAPGTELPLPAFAPPPGADVGKVLRWRWDVVLLNEGGELGKWQEHPTPMGGVTAEAEIGMPAPLMIPRGGVF